MNMINHHNQFKKYVRVYSITLTAEILPFNISNDHTCNEN